MEPPTPAALQPCGPVTLRPSHLWPLCSHLWPLCPQGLRKEYNYQARSLVPVLLGTFTNKNTAICRAAFDSLVTMHRHCFTLVEVAEEVAGEPGVRNATGSCSWGGHHGGHLWLVVYELGCSCCFSFPPVRAEEMHSCGAVAK